MNKQLLGLRDQSQKTMNSVQNGCHQHERERVQNIKHSIAITAKEEVSKGISSRRNKYNAKTVINKTAKAWLLGMSGIFKK